MENNNQTYINPNAIKDNSIHSSKLDSNSIRTINGESILGKGDIEIKQDTMFNEFTITKNDNEGMPDWVLIAEITALQSKESGGSTYGFTGMYNSHRQGGYGSEETGFITARAYWCKDKWILKSTGGSVKPYIVRYDPDVDLDAGGIPNKYWIALKLLGSGRNINFIGDKINLLDNFIHLQPGEIIEVAQPEDYILKGIGVNIKAVEIGNSAHEIEESTCLKYTEQGLTDSQKQQSIKNLGLFNLNTWYNSLPTNTVTGYQKDLIGAGSYPYITTSISTDTFTIQPNVFYNFGSVAGTMRIEFGHSSNDITNEYMFLFKATSSNTSLNAPNIVAWNKPLYINEGKTYLISILNGLATYLEF